MNWKKARPSVYLVDKIPCAKVVSPLLKACQLAAAPLSADCMYQVDIPGREPHRLLAVPGRGLQALACRLPQQLRGHRGRDHARIRPQVTAGQQLESSWTAAVYERVAVGRKYPCRRPLWICLLWKVVQSLFHVQLGSNWNLMQSLYVHPFWLWPDDNQLAWSGAIQLQKKAIILAKNWQSHQYFVHYLVSKVPF